MRRIEFAEGRASKLHDDIAVLRMEVEVRRGLRGEGGEVERAK